MDSEPHSWPGSYTSAVSLSYDGGDLGHLEVVAPLLDRLGLRATFYVPGGVLVENPSKWKALHDGGHEISNGALTDWLGWVAMGLKDAEDMVRAELRMGNEAVRDITGALPRSVGLPWVHGADPDALHLNDMRLPGVSFVRTGIEGFNHPKTVALDHLFCVPCSDFSTEEMLAIAESSHRAGSWCIFAFSGIGVGEQAVDRAAHEAFITALTQEKDRWLAPVADIATQILSTRIEV